MSIDAKQLVADVQNIKIRMTGMDHNASFIRQFVEDEMIQRLDEMKEWHRSMNKIRNQCQAMVDTYKDATKFLSKFQRFQNELKSFKKAVGEKLNIKEKDKQSEYDKHKKEIKPIGRPRKVKIAQDATAQ